MSAWPSETRTPQPFVEFGIRAADDETPVAFAHDQQDSRQLEQSSIEY
jgi:hypothetical protein